MYDVQTLNDSLRAALMSLNTTIQSPTAYGVANEPENFTVAVTYILSTTVTRLGNQTVEPAISEVCTRVY